MAVMGAMDSKLDHVVSNHRCHGHYLAFGGDVKSLLAEVQGLKAGVSSGRGGSQHLKQGNFFSNGIQGGGAPIACGLAMGEKRRGTQGIVACCIGDGTLGQGVLYESLNMASLWSLPVLFLVEANGYAQSTPTAAGVAGSIKDRAGAFGIQVMETSSTDAQELCRFGEKAVRTVRESAAPVWAVIHSRRLCAHSKGDDTRPAEEVERLCQSDPLELHAQKLSQSERERIDTAVTKTITEALASLEKGMR
ncbi:hypothetical protein PSDVSF_24400 [Pseudodesulfovibrio sediminis]|uniref:Dehydrogenase E1 component domain-containing protein n=1 Tax=Pseudodesulfovibrio sediminis TaxID=2810563 RepID=A0ABM7P890_9BACT|nr:hypothetical protein PSDVSF_24400 [Pseudodesulfovibrio sediminis]